jgi:hypothetical protein
MNPATALILKNISLKVVLSLATIAVIARGPGFPFPIPNIRRLAYGVTLR